MLFEAREAGCFREVAASTLTILDRFYCSSIDTVKCSVYVRGGGGILMVSPPLSSLGVEYEPMQCMMCVCKYCVCVCVCVCV